MFSAGCSDIASDNSQSFDTLDEDNVSTNNSIQNNVSIFNQTPWHKMPEMSLLDLAFKLKQAEMKIFGRDKRFGEKNDTELNAFIEDSKDIRLSSDLYRGIEPSAKRALLEINEKYRQLEASFPRNLMEEPLIRLYEPVTYPLEQTKVYENKIKKKYGCGWCGYNTDSKSHLHRHHKSMHRDRELKILTDPDLFIPQKKLLPPEGKRKHQCDMCSYQTDCKSHLRRHQGSVHCKDKLYECPICKVEFSRSEKAKEHHFAFHPEKSFDIRNMRKPPANDTVQAQSLDKIDKIKQLYGSADMLTKHQKSKLLTKSPQDSGTNGETSLMNSSDELVCDESKNEVEHDSTTWSDGSPEEKDSEAKRKSKLLVNNSFICLKCDYSCRDLWHLRRHVLDVHSSHKDHNCKVCHYATNRHHRLFCHMLKHGEFFCNFCNFSTINPEVYKLHFQVCSVVQKMTKCSICSKDFDDFVSYKAHITGEHRELIVTCPKCQFFTESSTELQTHLGLHVWEDKVCPICHFIADSEEAFSKHCRDSHMTFDPDWSQTWICSDCGKAETDKGMAAAHVASHNGAKRVCHEQDCSFCCHLEQSLELHLKYMHQGEDKASLCAYLNQLDAQMSHNKSSGRRSVDVRTNSVSCTLEKNKQNTEASEDDLTLGKPCIVQAVEEAIPSSSPASPEEDRGAVRSAAKLHSFSCPHCPDRAPFRYKKSYERHMSQHAAEKEEEVDGNEDDSGSK